MMRRLLPHPLFSLFVLIVWLILQDAADAATLILGGVLALVVPLVMRTLQPPPVRIKAPLKLFELVVVVAGDVLRSNWAVATVILGRRRRDRVSGFLYIPLQVRSPYALAVLALILTGTPGTLWVQYDAATGRLLMHVLDLIDEDAWLDIVKGRYERRLMEIFE